MTRLRLILEASIDEYLEEYAPESLWKRFWKNIFNLRWVTKKDRNCALKFKDDVKSLDFSNNELVSVAITLKIKYLDNILINSLRVYFMLTGEKLSKESIKYFGEGNMVPIDKYIFDDSIHKRMVIKLIANKINTEENPYKRSEL